MNKSDLIECICADQKLFTEKDIKLAVNSIMEQMSQALIEDDRIEIRGFGSFAVHKLMPYTGRNPKTGEVVALGKRHIPRFKPGKELRDKVNKHEPWRWFSS